MPKEFLLIRSDESSIPADDVAILNGYCKMYGLNFQMKDVRTGVELLEALPGNYDYVCFAGHGNEFDFGDTNDLTVSWDQISSWICQLNCLKFYATVMLYCCEGGLPQVGCKMVDKCPSLDFVVGPTGKEDSFGLLISYSLFLYHVERMKRDSVEALHLVQEGTGILFEHYHAGDKDPVTGLYYCKRCRGEEEDEDNL